MENEFIEENFHPNLNFLFKDKEKANEEEEKVKNCSSNSNSSNGLDSSGISESSLASLSDKADDFLFFKDSPYFKTIENDQNLFLLSELAQNPKKELIFKITYSPKYSLFNKTKVYNVLDEDDKK